MEGLFLFKFVNYNWFESSKFQQEFYWEFGLEILLIICIELQLCVMMKDKFLVVLGFRFCYEVQFYKNECEFKYFLKIEVIFIYR